MAGRPLLRPIVASSVITNIMFPSLRRRDRLLRHPARTELFFGSEKSAQQATFYAWGNRWLCHTDRPARCPSRLSDIRHCRNDRRQFNVPDHAKIGDNYGWVCRSRGFACRCHHGTRERGIFNGRLILLMKSRQIPSARIGSKLRLDRLGVGAVFVSPQICTPIDTGVSCRDCFRG